MMLRRKMIRDIIKNKSQFITIFLMILIGVMVYIGIESYMTGMSTASEKFYTKNNLQDLNVLGTSFKKSDLDKIKHLDNVKNAERKMEINATDADNKDKNYLVTFIESNNISRFHVIKGIPFISSKKGVWVDNTYAEKNNLVLGETIKIKYDTIVLEEPILGFINTPDHVYDTKDKSQLIPDHQNYGYIYMSVNEIPEDYINDLVVKTLGISTVASIPNYNYKEYIPYNYVMVDVIDKKNIEYVKNTIEDDVDNALAVVKIEDTPSYAMYQSEIDEGKAYVGIFSGLFLFIAMLTMITTMIRLVSAEQVQIGTLGALGFPKSKIILHYVSYGFYVALAGTIFGIIFGKLIIGNIFINLEMSFFEMPNCTAIINEKCFIMVAIIILIITFITYLTCLKELNKKPFESLRPSLPKVNKKIIKITTKKPFTKLSFGNLWNIRDMLQNKVRTITSILGVLGCCSLIVCAFGMLNSMTHLVKLQFDDLYNFKYKLTLKENISEEDYQNLQTTYGDSTSETINIEITSKNNSRTTSNIFVTDAGDKIRFKDKKDKYIDKLEEGGVYITRKLAETMNYKVGDEITFRIYGSNKDLTTKIIGLNKDPQNQNLTITRASFEALGLSYKPDSLYTNKELSKDLGGVDIIQDKKELKENMQSLLEMMRTMIILIIVFACLLGAVIIYNMGILSYSEKKYQFATLKVLGFDDKKIQKIYINQNIWITTISIILGLPTGYYLIFWLFKKCLDESYDFSVYVNWTTYLLGAIGTFLVAYLVSLFLSKKVKTIDMVSSLKSNE